MTASTRKNTAVACASWPHQRRAARAMTVATNDTYSTRKIHESQFRGCPWHWPHTDTMESRCAKTYGWPEKRTVLWSQRVVRFHPNSPPYSVSGSIRTSRVPTINHRTHDRMRQKGIVASKK